MKIHSIQTTAKFYRSLSKLPVILQEEATIKKEIFIQNPFDSSLRTHKLKGKLSIYWSFSVTRSYRIMFTFEDDGVVLFHDIGDHRIYQ